MDRVAVLTNDFFNLMFSFMLVQHKRFNVEFLLLKYNTTLKAVLIPCCLEFSKGNSDSSSVERIILFSFV